MNFLEEIYSLVAANNPNEAIDTLFTYIETLLANGRFDACNELLKQVNINKLDTNLMIGFLAITLKAKDKLPARKQLSHNIQHWLQCHEPKRNKSLMSGLE